MKTQYWMGVMLAVASTAVPASAQEAHQHGGEEGQATEAPAMMCHQMMGGQMMGGEMGEMGMEGHGMMNGQSMMSDAGMMSGGMGMGMMMQSMAGMPGMGMMLGNEPDASMILGAAEELGLDEDQIERLEIVRQRSLEIHEAHMAASVESREEASGLIATDAPDLDAYEQSLWEAAQHMVTAHLGLVRLSFEARDILTQNQIERLDAGVIKARHCSMMEDVPVPSAGHAGRQS